MHACLGTSKSSWKTHNVKNLHMAFEVGRPGEGTLHNLVVYGGGEKILQLRKVLWGWRKFHVEANISVSQECLKPFPGGKDQQ